MEKESRENLETIVQLSAQFEKALMEAIGTNRDDVELADILQDVYAGIAIAFMETPPLSMYDVIVVAARTINKHKHGRPL